MAKYFFIAALLLANQASAQDPQDLQPRLDQIESFVSNNCLDCHSGNESSADLDLETFDFSADPFSKPNLDTAPWETLHRRTHTRQMPPPDADRPQEEDYAKFVAALESILADYDSRFPKLGRIGELRRLTRTEYQNAIRDLLAIEIDAREYIPRDESSHGFDNITEEDLSTTRMSRYISAAQKISRLAVGTVAEAEAAARFGFPLTVPRKNTLPACRLERAAEHSSNITSPNPANTNSAFGLPATVTKKSKASTANTTSTC